MPNVAVRVLRTDKPGNSLAVWLGVHHPELFVATLRAARQAKATKKVQLRGLGDGTTTFDATDTFNPGSSGLVDTSFEPTLETVTLDPSITALPSNLLSDSVSNDSSGLLSTIGSNLSSVGSSVGDAFSGTLSALGQVGSFLGTAAGRTTLTTLGQAIFGTQPQGQVLNTQVARVATQQTAAPITYSSVNGQLVPVLASSTPQGTVYQPLTQPVLAGLTPSSINVFLSQYGMWLFAAAVVALLAKPVIGRIS